MTCSLCHIRGHNKRGCPSAPTPPPSAPSTVEQLKQEKGRPKKNAAAPTTTHSASLPPEGPNISVKGIGRPKNTPAVPTSAPMASVPPKGLTRSVKGRGKPKKTIEGELPQKRGRPKKTPSPSEPTDFPASCSAPPTYHAPSSVVATAKRPRVMGMGVFQAANGFKVMNPGMPSRKIYSTGQTKVTSSAHVTGDIGYTPSTTSKLKWNGKAAMSTRKLQELRDKQRNKTSKSSSSNPTMGGNSSQERMP